MTVFVGPPGVTEVPPGLLRWAVFRCRNKVSCLANFLLQHGHSMGFIWR